MGLAGNYRRFIIEGFSLEKKGVEFDWNPKCEDSFQRLKEMITIAHVLKITDPGGNFVVCIDACKQGVGGVLM